MKGVKTMENNKIERVPIHLKLALTSKEAAEYSNIGIYTSLEVFESLSYGSIQYDEG